MFSDTQQPYVICFRHHTADMQLLDMMCTVIQYILHTALSLCLVGGPDLAHVEDVLAVARRGLLVPDGAEDRSRHKHRALVRMGPAV